MVDQVWDCEKQGFWGMVGYHNSKANKRPCWCLCWCWLIPSSRKNRLRVEVRHTWTGPQAGNDVALKRYIGKIEKMNHSTLLGTKSWQHFFYFICFENLQGIQEKLQNTTLEISRKKTAFCFLGIFWHLRFSIFFFGCFFLGFGGETWESWDVWFPLGWVVKPHCPPLRYDVLLGWLAKPQSRVSFADWHEKAAKPTLNRSIMHLPHFLHWTGVLHTKQAFLGLIIYFPYSCNQNGHCTKIYTYTILRMYMRMCTYTYVYMWYLNRRTCRVTTKIA